MKHYGTNFLLGKFQQATLDSIVHYDNLNLDRMKLSFYDFNPNNVSLFDTFTQTLEMQEFIKSAEALMKNNSHKSYIMIMFDIDGFSDINEYYGYSAGNELLYYIDIKLASYLQEPDLFCRVRDDNYAVFIENNKEMDVALFVIHISEMISNYYPELQLKLSFGICKSGNCDDNISFLCSRAFYAKSTIKGSSQLMANYDEIIQHLNIFS